MVTLESVQAVATRNIHAGHGSQNNNNGPGSQFIASGNIVVNFSSDKIQYQVVSINDLLDWLSNPRQSPSEYLQNTIEKPTDQTGLWLLRDDEFHQWMGGDGKAAFLHGITGSGKTVLCRTIIDHLSRHITAPSHSLCFFFFRNQSDNSTVHFLGSILRQFCNPDDEALRIERHGKLRKKLEGRYYRREVLDEDLLVDSLISLPKDSERIYIVVDALDECRVKGKDINHTRRMIIDVLDRLLKSKKIQVLFSCRDGPFQERLVRSLTKLNQTTSFHDWSLKAEVIDQDINKLIQWKLETDLQILNDNEEWREKILEKVKPSGMFLLVARQLDLIQSQIQTKEWEDIALALTKLPQTINDIYASMLEQIQGDLKRRVAAIALKWLVCAQRPLRFSELNALISMEYPGPFDIQTTFSNLLVRRRNSGENQDAFVEFAHDTSIREYLTSEESGDFYVNPKAAHRQIAQMCLKYLRVIELGQKHDAHNHHSSTCPRTRKLLEYSINNWYRHALSIGQESDDNKPQVAREAERSQIVLYLRHLWAAVVEFGARHLNVIMFWLGLNLLHSSLTSEIKLLPRFKDIANSESLLELSRFSESLIESDSSFGDAQHSALLRQAALTGYKLMTSLLLMHEAPLGPKKEGYSALMAASTQNYPGMIKVMLGLEAADGPKTVWWSQAEETSNDSWIEITVVGIVELLLDHNASPNIHNKFKQTALHLAAGRGYTAIVEKLAGKMQDVDSKDYSGATPLHWAAAGGFKSTVHTLLEEGADVNARCDNSKKIKRQSKRKENLSELDRKIQDILRHENPDEDKAIHLLNEGADPNTAELDSGTILHWSILKRAERLTKELVARGADPNGVNPYDKAAKFPLTEATRNHNSAEIIKCLLIADADPNLPDHSWFGYRTPLHEAALRGDEETCRILLEFGADANMRDQSNNSAADSARSQGHQELAKILDKSAQGLDVRGGNGETALHIAAEQNHYDTVKELLKSGAKSDERTNTGWTVLHSAAGKGSVQLFTLLLKGSQIDAQADHKWSVFHEAAEKGNLEIIQWLLQHDPPLDINIRDSNGESPLSVSIASNQNAVAKLLLEQATIDADIDNWRQWTPLFSAVRVTNIEMMKVLLDRSDVDINWQELHYDRTALAIAGIENYLESARVLLERGAQMEFGDKFEKTALGYAVEGNHEEMVRLLRDYGATKVQAAWHIPNGRRRPSENRHGFSYATN